MINNDFGKNFALSHTDQPEEKRDEYKNEEEQITEPTNFIERVPIDVLKEHILSHLGALDLLNFNQLDKKFHKVTEDDELWKSRFTSPPPSKVKLEFINKFKTASNNARAFKDGRSIDSLINGITDQQALIEIAKTAAAQHGGRTSLLIRHFGITDQNGLIEIAKIAATQGHIGISYHIQNYGITDQKALIEIAKIAADKNGTGTSIYIEKYGITDQEALIEIAMKAAAQDGEGTSKYIKNYGITDKNALSKILQIAATGKLSTPT